MGDLLIAVMTPVALEVTLAVEQELRVRADEAEGLRRKQVDRARYEAELARRRYMHVDPDSRLVADALEGEWNNRLRALANAQEEYGRRREANPLTLDAQLRARVVALARDFLRLWRDPSTPDRERKRMARLMLEGVMPLKGADVAVQVRFKGGATRSLTVPRAKAWSTVCSASRGPYTGATHSMPLGSAPAPPRPCPKMDTHVCASGEGRGRAASHVSVSRSEESARQDTARMAVPVTAIRAVSILAPGPRARA
jgi:hypothetical protein